MLSDFMDEDYEQTLKITAAKHDLQEYEFMTNMMKKFLI